MKPVRRWWVLTALGCAALAAAFALLALAERWAPLRGPNYDAERGAFRSEDLADPKRIEGAPAFRLVLIGDAGAPEPEDPTLALLGRWADAHPERTTVVFLGDNIYPAGLRRDAIERGERILRQQIDATRAPKIFLPGNHDWGLSWNRPYEPGALARQQAFMDAHAEHGVSFAPRDGCPGPVAVELLDPGGEIAGGLTLLLLDLHWWLLEETERPVCEPIDSTMDFIAALRDELATRRHQNVIIAAHHPIRSGGPHGGYTRGFWRDLGIALFYRFYAVQDLVEPSYREAVGLISEVASESPPLAMVGGHDHSLQIIDGGDEARLVVVSGAATKVSRVTRIPGTLFAHAHRGFVVFDFHAGTATAPPTLRVQVAEVGHAEPVAAVAFDLEQAQATPREAAGAR